jgi:hypothetical protein
MVEIKDDIPDGKFPEEAERLWAQVFKASNRVLHQHKMHGFDGIELVPNPNIHDVVVTLKAFDTAIESLIEAADLVNMPYESRQQLLNAKAQIANMNQLASALKAKRQKDYDAAVEALQKQAVI